MRRLARVETMSPRILSNTARMLAEAGVGHAEIEEYVATLDEIAGYSGGRETTRLHRLP